MQTSSIWRGNLGKFLWLGWVLTNYKKSSTPSTESVLWPTDQWPPCLQLSSFTQIQGYVITMVNTCQSRSLHTNRPYSLNSCNCSKKLVNSRRPSPRFLTSSFCQPLGEGPAKSPHSPHPLKRRFFLWSNEKKFMELQVPPPLFLTTKKSKGVGWGS